MNFLIIETNLFCTQTLSKEAIEATLPKVYMLTEKLSKFPAHAQFSYFYLYMHQQAA